AAPHDQACLAMQVKLGIATMLARSRSSPAGTKPVGHRWKWRRISPSLAYCRFESRVVAGKHKKYRLSHWSPSRWASRSPRRRRLSSTLHKIAGGNETLPAGGRLLVEGRDAAGLRSGLHLSAVLCLDHAAVRADANVAARPGLVCRHACRHSRRLQNLRI